ncbi:formyltransferase family protein [Schleiferiaceae bacterium]|nr:formyltransferase family protein [Schleiferiaceae bacterium]
MKKVLFLGSKPIGHYCLLLLIEKQAELGIELVGALSNDNSRFDPTKSISKLCELNQVPFIEDLDQILDMDVDIMISVQYHLILKKPHIDVAKEIAVNLHMAPLPEYRGCNQFSFALFNQSKVFGTTLHRLEEGIDSGPIMFERRFDIEANDDVSSLYQKTFEESKLLFAESISDLVKGAYQLKPQSEYFEEREHNLYYRKDIQKLKQIDLNESADTIIRAVNSSSMPGFEPPFALIDGKKYYIIPEKHYSNGK